MSKDLEVKKIQIDVQYYKIVEWLLERKKICSGWQENLRGIRDEINKALCDLPNVPEITNMLKGKYLHYYHCKKIFKLLEDAEGGRTKNIFGQYTTTLLRNWNNILKMYEADNVFLGEAGRILLQNTKYLCPSLKKTIQQCEKQVQDLEKKVQDYRKGITTSKKNFEKACKELGIQGLNFRAELMALTAELPAFYKHIEETVSSKEISDALEYHKAFTRFLLGIPEAENQAGEEQLSYLHKQNRRGVSSGADAPTVQEPSNSIAEVEWSTINAESSFPTVEIDWQASADAHVSNKPVTSESIDWDISIAGPDSQKEAVYDAQNNPPDQSIEIDWDMSIGGDSSIQDLKLASIEAAPHEIDWNITLDNPTGGAVEGHERIQDLSNWDISIADTGSGLAQSFDEEKCTFIEQPGKSLLEDRKFRDALTCDLTELQAFLLHRKVELSDENNVLYANQFQGASPVLQRQTAEAVALYLKVVEQVFFLLSDKRFHQLTMIKESPPFLDRLENQLHQKANQTQKFEALIREAESREAENINVLSKSVPELKNIVDETKILKVEAEKSLSLLFNVDLRITGEINSL